MGTKVHCKSYLPGLYSMRDLNENYSSGSWPVFYGDKTVSNGQYYNGYMPRTLVDGYPEHEKDTLKQKMLEHEAVFKNQVCELHRLYRIQRDMMEEVKRKDVHNYRASMEPASSSNHHGSQVPLEDSRKWHMAGFPLLNSSYGRTPIMGVENLNSPISCTKEIITQPGQSPFWSTSKISEALDSRPSKVRKKLFDLQLPADQYVDPEDEQSLCEYKERDISSYAKTDGRMDASASTSRLMGSTGLADLNEPIQIDDEMGTSSVDFLGRSRTLENVEIGDVHRPAKMAAGYLCLTGDAMLVRDGFSINSSAESQVNEKEWFAHINKAGSSRNLSSVTQGPYAGKYMHPNGYTREDLWREGFRQGPESSRSYDHPNSSHLETVASKNPVSHPFFSSSSFASSRAYPVSSWAKPTSNGFYHSPASGSKEPQVPSPSAGYDHLNSSRVDNNACSTNHGFGNFPKGPYRADPKPVIDFNLNDALPESPLNETVIPEEVTTADGKGKPEDNLQTLPWLKRKPVHVDKVSSTSRSDASSNQLSGKNETVGVTLTSCDPEIPRKQEIKKILGVPIFERDVPETGPSMLESKIVGNGRRNGMIDINVACGPEEQESPEKGLDVKELIDLNCCLSDHEDPPYEQQSSSVTMKMEIDLEVPVFLESEDDSTFSKEKMAEEVLSESLKNKHEQKQEDDVLANAVETLVSISSCPKTSIEDCVSLPTESSVDKALLWFVDAVDKESKTLETSEEMDDFEAMTLQLVETREEDYMPKPFVPEFPETGQNALTTRTRRGHSRRGRQRRDFQRDILPGLTSLSRHEVTEDLQTFGGLMRATGHSWSSGLVRRNGGGRGRRRAVVERSPAAIPGPVCPPLIKQLSSVEAGLEDRSLTGWGKTTRRPRRQRCPAGNPPPAVVLT